MNNILKRASQRLLGKFRSGRQNPPNPHWSAIERFEDEWRARISLMAQHIPKNAAVIDLGCGPMWLKEYLDGGSYVGVDYVDRGANMLVCDFNKYEYPELQVDCSFVSGCLEYVEDPEWFIGRIATTSTICILSYCTLDEFPDVSARRQNAWVNDMFELDIVKVFEDRNMTLTQKTKTLSNNTIFVFQRT